MAVRKSAWLDAKPVEFRSGTVVPGTFVSADEGVVGRALVEVGRAGNVVSVPAAGLFAEGQVVGVQVSETGKPVGVLEQGDIPEGATVFAVGSTAERVKSAEELAEDTQERFDVVHDLFEDFVPTVNGELSGLRDRADQAAADLLAEKDRVSQEFADMMQEHEAAFEGFDERMVGAEQLVGEAWGKAEEAYASRTPVVKIESTRGTAFKNNTVSTDLNVTVFFGEKTITSLAGLHEEFGVAAYLEWWWRKLDEDDFGLVSSGDDRLSRGGFTLTVSPADVDEQTTFRVTLNV